MSGNFIKAFYYLVNAIRIHQDNNQLIRDCVTQFYDIMNDMSEGDDVSLDVWRGRFHVQGEKLRYKRDIFQLINEMLEYFSKRKLGGVFFHAGFRDTPPEDLKAFIRILNDSAVQDAPYDWLEKQLKQSGFSWVEVSKEREEDVLTHDELRKERAQHAYFNSLNTVREVAEKASQGITGVRKARRLAQTIVDLVQEDNSLMLGLATIRDYDDYTYTHSVNVALLATCLGKYIGLSKVTLEYLTVCGLFHDLGKVEVSKDILLKAGCLSPTEWDQMQRHSIIGVRKILRLQAPHSLKSRIILGPFEHHLNPDLSGYPKTHFMKKLSLIGRILRIVDVYEALTAERSYRPRSFSPDEALRRMWSERGKSFDTPLLKSFINMMGIYPIGSVVEMDSGEIGVVMDYTDESQKALPVVLLLVENDKGGLSKGETINLADQGMSNNGFPMNVKRGIPCSRLGIQPSQFFL